MERMPITVKIDFIVLLFLGKPVAVGSGGGFVTS